MSDTGLDPQLVKEFIVEAEETLTNLSNDLLALENTPEDPDLIKSVFRAAHGIKGMSAMFGFKNVSELTHEMENVLDQVRQGKLRIDKRIMDALFSGFDLTRELVEEIRSQEDHGIDITEAISMLRGILDKEEEKKVVVQFEVEEIHPGLREQLEPFHLDEIRANILKGEKLVEVELNLVDSVLSLDLSPMTYFRIINIAGNLISSTSIFLGVPDLADFDPEQNYFKLSFLLTSIHEEKKIQDLFTDFVPQVHVRTIKSTIVDLEGKDEPTVAPVGPAGEEKEGETKVVKEAKAVAVAQTLRVEQEKIDLFMNLVGEQTIITNTISNLGKKLKAIGVDRFKEEAEELYNASIAGERIIEELQKSVLSIRMLPLKTIFQNFPRIIRDVSGKTGKEIRFDVVGDDVALDKNIIDRINDPLVHMIRNSADHGIEPPEQREEQGKDPAGMVKLTARIEDKYVIIDIEDDGAGIALDRVREKALTNGVVSRQELDRMSRKQIQMLIFAPGFSTAEKITDVSGRGVGMDIVLTTVKDLEGSVDIESEEGKGTKMSLSIPVNLGILEKMLMIALIVEIGGEQYAIPIDDVVETLAFEKKMMEKLRNRNTIYLRGEVLGVVRLSDLLSSPAPAQVSGNGSGGKEEIDEALEEGEEESEGGMGELEQKDFPRKESSEEESDISEEGESDPPLEEEIEEEGEVSVVVISNGKKQVGVTVDRLLGQRSIVIKPLQSFLGSIKEVRGATILGNGRVVLILETEELLARAALKV